MTLCATSHENLSLPQISRERLSLETFLDAKSSQTSSKLIAFGIFGNSKTFDTVLTVLKLQQLSDQNLLRLAVLGNCFSNLFTKVET